MYSEIKKRNACTPAKLKQIQNETLQVFCRLRPLVSPFNESCIEILSDSTIQLTLPDTSVNYRTATCVKYQYSFQKVFSDSNPQKEIFDEVVLPLVHKLIKGNNGLLFTYGVTGSGKTYTMTGEKNNIGMMPRCLDVIFNSISEYQAKKFVFKPDRMNGFDIQTEQVAKKELEESLKRIARCGRLRKNQSQEDLISARSNDGTKCEDINPDNAYAVFVTYIEIYNDNVFDLLENINETDICMKLQTKIIREDAYQNGYVHGVTEVEVKSADEAFEIFYKGKKRKRTAQTILNTESSRSHSIFTIRLVQAPLDMNGIEVDQNKENICISQLSLVDLAGSERTSRTNNTGERVREAGSINNSLMTLRNCLEVLRENQRTGILKKIPCRDSKLTRLFRIFFEGMGDIRMIICVNPNKDDYDETVQVMKFAEASQEIVLKPTPLKPTPMKTDGKRKANQIYKKALRNLEEVKERESIAYIPDDAEMIYCLEPFPSLENTDPFDADFNKNLMNFLEDRIKKKKKLQTDIAARVTKFRAIFLEREEKYLKFQRELDAVSARRECENIKIKTLEDKVVSMDTNINVLRRKCEEYTNEIKRLRQDNDNKENIIQQYNVEKDKEKRINQKMAAKTEKLAKEKENSIKEKKQIESQLKEKEKKLRRVKKALDSQEDFPYKGKMTKIDDDLDTEIIASSNENEVVSTQTPVLPPQQHLLSPSKSSSVVSNLRYNKTTCGNHDQWLDHRPTIIAPLNTVLQPTLKRRKSFTTITSPKDVNKNSKYCLMTQNQDEDGSVETQIYKGDVVPTCGGGAQIILNDVEILRQTSPVTSPPISPKKKKVNGHNTAIAAHSSSSLYPDIANRCAISVEGHSIKNK